MIAIWKYPWDRFKQEEVFLLCNANYHRTDVLTMSHVERRETVELLQEFLKPKKRNQ